MLPFGKIKILQPQRGTLKSSSLRLFILLILCIFLSESKTYAQCKYDAVWTFGDSCGIDFSDTSNITTFTSLSHNVESDASISDCDGNLLFYTADFNYNGSPYIFSLFGSDNVIIANADSLNGGYSTTQGTLILPFSYDSSKSYVFHIGRNAISNDASIFYTIVDMDANNGQGAAIEKNVNLLPSISIYNSTEKMIAVKTAHNDGYWLMNLTRDNLVYAPDTFIRYKVLDDTIEGPYYQIFEDYESTFLGYAGYMVFNHQGNRLAVTNGKKSISIFDFDRCTGLLSNMEYIDSVDQNALESWYYGLCFSKNGRFLYTTMIHLEDGLPHRDTLIQYDLLSSDIYSSRYLYVPNEDICPQLGSAMGALALAPDGRIYVSNVYSYAIFNDTASCLTNEYLSVINNPEQKCPDCDFQEYSFYLGGHHSFLGLPNMINYNLGPLATYLYSAGNDTSIFTGDSVQIGVPAMNNYSYIWQPDDGSLSSTTVAQPIASPTQTTQYILLMEDTVNNSCGFMTDTVIVTVNWHDVIKSVGDEGGIRIYPNPVNELCVVSCELCEVENAVLKVYDVMGKEIYSSKFFNGDFKLETPNFSSGIYFVRIDGGDGRMETGRFVVVR